MPRCFFHIHDGRTYLDHHGIDLPDITAVQEEAVRVSGKFMANRGGKFWRDREMRLDVTDANGSVLFSLTFLVDRAPTRPNPALLTGALTPP